MNLAMTNKSAMLVKVEMSSIEVIVIQDGTKSCHGVRLHGLVDLEIAPRPSRLLSLCNSYAIWGDASHGAVWIAREVTLRMGCAPGNLLPAARISTRLNRIAGGTRGAGAQARARCADVAFRHETGCSRPRHAQSQPICSPDTRRLSICLMPLMRLTKP